MDTVVTIDSVDNAAYLHMAQRALGLAAFGEEATRVPSEILQVRLYISV